jgi:hypothetical protein
MQKRLSEYGYNLNYAQSVRRAALMEAVQDLTLNVVLKRLSSRKGEIIHSDLEWLQQNVRNIVQKEQTIIDSSSDQDHDSIARSLKKRTPRTSALKAMEIITQELTNNPTLCDTTSEDDTFTPDSEPESEEDSDYEQEVELLES